MSPLLRKPDGSVVEVFRNPDGSWFEVPQFRPHVPSVSQPKPASSAARPLSLENVRQFLREIGRRGGQARAARHTRQEIADWGECGGKRNRFDFRSDKFLQSWEIT